VRAVVPNPELELRPGMFVTARLTGATWPSAIVVPQRAVQKSADGHMVWLVNAQGLAEPRPVLASEWVGEDWLIERGLAGGETLIVDGFQRLAPGAPVTATGRAGQVVARGSRDSSSTGRSSRRSSRSSSCSPASSPCARPRSPSIRTVAPPTVTVTATYPGATAEVIANTVAAPIEQQVNGVEGMIYMSSTSSSSGAMTLTVTFEPGTDPDIAQVNTQNRVSQALSRLPEVVTRQGVNVEKKSSTFMMLVELLFAGRLAGAGVSCATTSTCTSSTR
jgi:hypothetical protein